MNPDGTTDKNLFNFGPEHNGTVQDLRPLGTLQSPDGSHTGIIKVSGGADGITILADKIIGARETFIDINNRASNIRVLWTDADVSPCKYGISNKGGAWQNYFEGGIRGRAKECEFFQDNWSDQSHLPSGAMLCMHRLDGTATLRLRYLLNQPVLNGGGPYEFIFPGPDFPLPRPLIYAGFNELRRHSLTARLFGLT